MINRSPRRSVAAALVLAVACGPSGVVAADEGLNVIAYRTDPVGTRDADGRPLRRVPTSDLPPTPARVIDVQHGAVLVATAGKGVWLDRDDVELDRSGSVRQLCNSLAVASGSEQIAAVRIATRASCAKQLAP
jgi:hypothetical protein